MTRLIAVVLRGGTGDEEPADRSGAIVVVALAVGGMYVGRRNQMVTKSQAVEAQWHNVDVVSSAPCRPHSQPCGNRKGFCRAGAKSVWRNRHARVPRCWARRLRGDRRQRTSWTARSARLLAVVENYPQLRSNENFLRLQDELAGTENRISVERRRYNDMVQDYNTYIGLFPNKHIRRLGRLPSATTRISPRPRARAPCPKWSFLGPPPRPLRHRPRSNRGAAGPAPAPQGFAPTQICKCICVHQGRIERRIRRALGHAPGVLRRPPVTLTVARRSASLMIAAEFHSQSEGSISAAAYSRRNHKCDAPFKLPAK